MLDVTVLILHSTKYTKYASLNVILDVTLLILHSTR